MGKPAVLLITVLLLVLFLITALLFVVLVTGVIIYNGVVKAEKQVEEAQAQIETLYQRRVDLVPNLVETVKGYAKHESQTFTAVAEARSKAQAVLQQTAGVNSLSKEQIKAVADSQLELGSTLKGLFAIVENYPSLRASTNFLTLQDQLEGTENRITVARERYNSSVRYYNTKLAVFPSNMIAGSFGFKEKVYFEAKEDAKDSSKVTF